MRRALASSPTLASAHARFQSARQSVRIEIVHALRGWPTPLGAAINSAERVFDEAGACLMPRIAETLERIAAEVMEFAR